MDPRVEKILKLPLYQRLFLMGLILAALAGGFLYMLYLPAQEELAKLQEENRTLESKLQEDRRIARNLPKFKAEYEKMQEQLEQALTELPNEKEIPTLLTSLSSLAKDNGLEVLRFKPGSEAPRGFYAEVPVALKLNGSYHQLALFFQDVGKLPRIVNIGNLAIGSSNKNQEGRNTLSVDCMATTFRFLETDKSPAKGKK